MEIVIEIIAVLLFGLLIFWLGGRILEKAGFDPRWVFVLAIPVVGVIMVWVFALSEWPNLKKTHKE